MQTYSHLIITAIINRRLKQREAQTGLTTLPPVRTGALMWGSIVPDLPLIAMGVTLAIYDALTQANVDPSSEAFRQQSMLGRLFDDWFFNSPWVIAPHNLFHSPTLDMLYIAVAYWLWRVKGYAWSAWFFWLSCAALLHTLIDIPLHYDDGPLLLFPFNWEIRFFSPVSYWDPRRYGVQFAILEHLFVLLLSSYLWLTYRSAVWGWLTRRPT